MSIWLVGSGLMAVEYAKVLVSLGNKFIVIGRGKKSAQAFTKENNISVLTGGITKALKDNTHPRTAIVAVGVEELSRTASELIKAGTKRILIEKPGGIDLEEIDSLNIVAEKYNAAVLLAYNRRFYNSVKEAKNYISQDGGILSAQFEFTEWAHTIEPLVKANKVKERWLLGNSSHVLDLAFHFIGKPLDWKFWHAGSLEWHPDAARFAGAGISENNIMFNYHADWQTPGRWGIELNTLKHRLILRPLEKLQVCKIGSVKVEEVSLKNDLDSKYKPGLYRQTESFLKEDDYLFCSLKEQLENTIIYSQIAGYRTK